MDGFGLGSASVLYCNGTFYRGYTLRQMSQCSDFFLGFHSLNDIMDEQKLQTNSDLEHGVLVLPYLRCGFWFIQSHYSTDTAQYKFLYACTMYI
jgi:hypothetical protein